MYKVSEARRDEVGVQLQQEKSEVGHQYPTFTVLKAQQAPFALWSLVALELTFW